MSVLASQPVFPISELSPYHRSWVIKARVTTKSAPRTFQRKGGGADGKLFSVELLDAEGGQIRATFFNEGADTYQNMLVTGKVFFFSGGSLRIANKQYNTCAHRYEISFDRGCNIEQASDDDTSIGSMKFDFVDLRSVQSRVLPCVVDLCGVVQSAQDVARIQSKAGNELIKRDVVIADDTGYTLNVTIWGEEHKLKNSDFEGNPVLAFKAIRINDFNERSGSTLQSSVIQINPEKVPEVTRIQSWWAQGGSTQQLTALSQQRGPGMGGPRADAKMLSLSEVRSQTEFVGEKPEYFQTVARLQTVQLRKQGEKKDIYYVACAEPKPNGLSCNRKVMENGTCPVCDKQGKTSVRLYPRCMYADGSDGVWMTTFDQGAQVVLGHTGEEVRDADKGGDKLEALFQMKYNSAPFKLILRAKQEEYQGERKSRVECVDAKPVSFAEHGRNMLKEVMDMMAVH